MRLYLGEYHVEVVCVEDADVVLQKVLQVLQNFPTFKISAYGKMLCQLNWFPQ